MPKSIIDVVIDSVKERQATFAHGKLKNPQDKTAFGYGFASGYYTAMDEVVGVIKDALEAEKNRD